MTFYIEIGPHYFFRKIDGVVYVLGGQYQVEK